MCRTGADGPRGCRPGQHQAAKAPSTPAQDPLRRRIIRLLGLCGVVAFCSLPGASPCAASGTGGVTGYVLDKSTKAAVAAAKVSIGGVTGTTNGSGYYNLSGIPSGTQTATATASGYLSASLSVSVPRRSTITAPTLFLAENWGTVSGVVKNGSTGAALANASVTVANTTLSAVTDATGSFTIQKVPAGSETVSASAPGFQAAAQTVSVPVNGTASATLALSASTVAGPGSTIFWNGQSSYLLGADFAWSNYGTDFGTGGWGKFTDWTTIASQFATLHSQGVRIVRWWLFADGRYSPDFNSDGTVSGLDNSVLPDLDQAMQIAANNQIYLLFTVIDSSMWNTASFSGSIQMGGHSAIITNSTVQQSFLDNALLPVLTHVAASPNSRYVLGYDLVNEPEANMSGYWGGVGLQAAAVQAFVQRCAGYVHTYGGSAYATVGSATPYYVSTWKGLGLDFYQLHYYPWMDFSNGAGSGLPTYASLALDKPCIVGEFPTADASYGLNDTSVQSARWYLDAIYGKGYAGALGWSYVGGDSASNWSQFSPVFSNWAQLYRAYVGPN